MWTPHSCWHTLRLVCCHVTVGVSQWEESRREDKVNPAPHHPAAASRARVEHHTGPGAYSQHSLVYTAGSGDCCKKVVRDLELKKLSWVEIAVPTGVFNAGARNTLCFLFYWRQECWTPSLQCAMLAVRHLDPAALTPAFTPCVCTWTAQKAECLLGVTACPGLTV